MAPDSKRQAVTQAVEALNVSERRACQVIGQLRSTQDITNDSLMTKSCSGSGSSSWRVNIAAMDIGGSPVCCDTRAGLSITGGCSVSGARKG